MKLLEKIRNKNLEEQKMISIGVAFTITSFIFAIWLLTMVYGFSGFETNDKSQNTASPVNIVTDNVKGLFKTKEVYIAE